VLTLKEIDKLPHTRMTVNLTKTQNMFGN